MLKRFYYFYIMSPIPQATHYYVMCKPWMWTIQGLCCSKHGSALTQTIYRLLAQSVDHTKGAEHGFAKSSDNDVNGRLFEQAGVAGMHKLFDHLSLQNQTAYGIGKIYCQKDGSSFIAGADHTPSRLEIQVQYNFFHCKGDILNLSKNFASALCVTNWPYTLSYDQFNT